MPKRSGAPDVGDLVTPRQSIEVDARSGRYWQMGEPRLVVATRGIEIQVMREVELVWVMRGRVEVVNGRRETSNAA